MVFEDLIIWWKKNNNNKKKTVFSWAAYVIYVLKANMFVITDRNVNISKKITQGQRNSFFFHLEKTIKQH